MSVHAGPTPVDYRFERSDPLAATGAPRNARRGLASIRVYIFLVGSPPGGVAATTASKEEYAIRVRFFTVRRGKFALHRPVPFNAPSVSISLDAVTMPVA